MASWSPPTPSASSALVAGTRVRVPTVWPPVVGQVYQPPGHLGHGVTRAMADPVVGGAPQAVGQQPHDPQGQLWLLLQQLVESAGSECHHLHLGDGNG